MANTFVATAAAGLSWMFVEWIFKGKPSLLGLASGVVAGLVAVTPASGYAGPMGALVLGLVAGAICFFFCTAVKNALGYDDTLDVFGVHAIGGFVGAIGTGIVAAPFYGGAGVIDYTKCVVKDGMVTSRLPHRRLRHGGSGSHSVQERTDHRRLVCGGQPDRVPHHFVDRRLARFARERARGARHLRSMASAPTTCKQHRGRREGRPKPAGKPLFLLPRGGLFCSMSPG